MELIDAADDLARKLSRLRFGKPVTHVYNVFEYARIPYDAYLKRFGRKSPREVVLVGMNPGPWGMAQTGVPFGEVAAVRDWMGIEAEVDRPAEQHPKRPIEGFECPRSEVSGRRLWGWARDRFGKPERFFERFFVVNYCPLVFMEESGRNRTPAQLRKKESDPLHEACDEHLRRVLEYLEPELVVGIGQYAEDRVRRVLENGQDDAEERPQVGRILHPSPANPQANRGWVESIEASFEELGVKLPS